MSQVNFVGEEDAVVVAMLKKQGAIPIVRGNVPQWAMIMHTTNWLFGTSMNPYDETRTVGGSSGGDAGIVSSKCAAFSVGSDIGGSIRNPAANCGIIGFKPTPQRVSQKGIVMPVPKKDLPLIAIETAWGPLCHSVDDAKAFMKTVLCDEVFTNLDFSVPPIPFNEDAFNKTLQNKQLRIGYLCYTDSKGKLTLGSEILPLSKASKRAMSVAMKAFEKAGHMLVPFEINL